MSKQNTVPLHPNEFKALYTAIGGYLTFLRNAVQPSRERSNLIEVLQTVRFRLDKVLRANEDGAHLWLTEVEVSAIDTAVQTFCRLVPWVVEPSQQRDETLQALDKLRLRVSALLVPRSD
ncbi:MAG: hypothetical protein JO202_03655 [Ktedonobacteraceae bacterium]|nr:hypothetical protein [Ktedonobacteraceae bacterium]